MMELVFLSETSFACWSFGDINLMDVTLAISGQKRWEVMVRLLEFDICLQGFFLGFGLLCGMANGFL